MIFSYLAILPAIAQTQGEAATFAPFATLLAELPRRLSLALSTIPHLDLWLQVTELVVFYTFIALPIGFKLGFLTIDLQTSWVKVVGVTVSSFFSPAITEEVFFRILLLPHPTENASAWGLWLSGCASLAIFIAYHPLNALTFFPAGRQTFLNPIFLLLTALLGAACAIAYLQSGSLWPPVLMHWLAVSLWLLVFGGYKRLYG